MNACGAADALVARARASNQIKPSQSPSEASFLSRRGEARAANLREGARAHRQAGASGLGALPTEVVLPRVHAARVALPPLQMVGQHRGFMIGGSLALREDLPHTLGTIEERSMASESEPPSSHTCDERLNLDYMHNVPHNDRPCGCVDASGGRQRRTYTVL